MPIVGLASAIALVACQGNRAAQSNEGRTDGEIAFRSSCQTCHSLPNPAKWTDDQWPTLVQRYGELAHLSEQKIDAITAYLTAVN